MARKARDRVERLQGIQHIGYELEQCCDSAALLLTTDSATLGTLHNALLESEVLHARALIDFFVRPGSRVDDMVPSDFAPDGVKPWIPDLPHQVGRLSDPEVRDLINKHLAHLSWARVDADQPTWRYYQVANDLLDLATDWRDYLAEHDGELRNHFAPFVFHARSILEQNGL